MKHYLLPLAIFFVAVTSAVAKDDITKELITSNGKTRAYYLYVPSITKASARPADCDVARIGSRRNVAGGEVEGPGEKGKLHHRRT